MAILDVIWLKLVVLKNYVATDFYPFSHKMSIEILHSFLTLLNLAIVNILSISENL